MRCHLIKTLILFYTSTRPRHQQTHPQSLSKGATIWYPYSSPQITHVRNMCIHNSLPLPLCEAASKDYKSSTENMMTKGDNWSMDMSHGGYPHEPCRRNPSCFYLLFANFSSPENYYCFRNYIEPFAKKFYNQGQYSIFFPLHITQVRIQKNLA